MFKGLSYNLFEFICKNRLFPENNSLTVGKKKSHFEKNRFSGSLKTRKKVSLTEIARPQYSDEMGDFS